MIQKSFNILLKTMGQCFPCIKEIHTESDTCGSTNSSPRVPIGRAKTPVHNAPNTHKTQTKVVAGYTRWKTTTRTM